MTGGACTFPRSSSVRREPRENGACTCPGGQVATEVAAMWSPQRYIRQGHVQDVPRETLCTAVDSLDRFYAQQPDIPALLTLGHLAQRTQVPYWRLRSVVERSSECYRHFTIRKRSGGRRNISVPQPDLMTAQRWLTVHILNKQPVHPASYAFKPGSSITHCAARHTGARWLVKMDISSFFNAISEIQVFHVFRSLGYQPLVAFELARLTTYTSYNSSRYRFQKWRNSNRHATINMYKNDRVGHLPQGAPTSPMLSNLVMQKLDCKIANVAKIARLNYTRYSDDLTFSTRGNFTRALALKFIRTVTDQLRPASLFPNLRKTVIVPPGARKIVLGLVVDDVQPRLSREFRNGLRQHLYYLKKFGPIEHMNQRGFETVLGMKYHIRGRIDFAHMVDRPYAEEMLAHFQAVDWLV